LGFLLAARMGAVRSISRFHLLTGFIYLVIAAACFVPYGAWLLLPAWILLHLSRSCSVAMNFPLQKNITTPEEMPVLLSRIQVANTVTGLGTTLLIVWLLARYPGKILLPVLFAAAFLMYVVCSRNIRRVVEPAALQRMANHPVIKQALTAWRIPHIRHQIYVGSAMNLSLAMLPAINILAMKQGYRLADSTILLLGAVQAFSSIAASFLYRKLAFRFGPEKMLVAVCPLLWLLFLYWIFAPETITLWTALPPFIFTGFFQTIVSTGLGNYFTNTVDNPHQIGGTFWVFVVTGGLMGICGMIFNPLIFKLLQIFGNESGMDLFRSYFLVTAFLFAGLICAPFSLVLKKRKAD
ncbi:MAG: MFS transporter, partial [Lentisphaeria bacterium]|nr:MFS transporter [Lentisphaeria bacterium]